MADTIHIFLCLKHRRQDVEGGNANEQCTEFKNTAVTGKHVFCIRCNYMVFICEGARFSIHNHQQAVDVSSLVKNSSMKCFHIQAA